MFLGPGPPFLTTPPPTRILYGVRAVWDHSDPTLPTGTQMGGTRPSLPPYAPIPVPHPPRDKSQTNSPMCSFWATPFSAAALWMAMASERAKQQLSESVSHMGHSPDLFCSTSPPLSTSCTSPKAPVPSSSPYFGAHKGLLIPRSSGFSEGPFNMNARPKGMGF